MAAPAIACPELASGASYKGTVVAFGRDGRPLVRAAHVAATVCCDILDTGLGVLEIGLGETVAFSTYADAPGTGCILGRVVAGANADAPIRRRSLRLEVDELIVHARTQVSFHTDRARLLMNKAGDLEILASTVVSKARRLQRFLAPMLRLN